MDFKPLSPFGSEAKWKRDTFRIEDLVNAELMGPLYQLAREKGFLLFRDMPEPQPSTKRKHVSSSYVLNRLDDARISGDPANEPETLFPHTDFRNERKVLIWYKPEISQNEPEPRTFILRHELGLEAIKKSYDVLRDFLSFDEQECSKMLESYQPRNMNVDDTLLKYQWELLKELRRNPQTSLEEQMILLRRSFGIAYMALEREPSLDKRQGIVVDFTRVLVQFPDYRRMALNAISGYMAPRMDEVYAHVWGKGHLVLLPCTSEIMHYKENTGTQTTMMAMRVEDK